MTNELEARPAVEDWATDYDIFDAGYVADPYGIWDQLRTECPIARTERWGGSWLPTRYDDVTAMARDIETFPSGNGISVMPPPMNEDGVVTTPLLAFGLPPISADPPLHTWTRRLILPTMSHERVAEYEPYTRALCRQLAADIQARGSGDAAADYAQRIPVRVIGHLLGVPESMAETFTGWVRDVLEFAHDDARRLRGIKGLLTYLTGALDERRANPTDDFISELLAAEQDGQPLDNAVVMGMCALLLIAGVDTTWSSIGSALWHLAQHPDDCRRLIEEPELITSAVEELLRAYSPVTMARRLTNDTTFQGCPMHAGDRILMNFPAANRDPEAFPEPDRVILDREHNRHVAFGAGIHRCAGSNLARMELRVAIEEWLAAMPHFSISNPAEVTWAGGQVRGPRTVPIVCR
jgi:cytochrome P450